MLMFSWLFFIMASLPLPVLKMQSMSSAPRIKYACIIKLTYDTVMV